MVLSKLPFVNLFSKIVDIIAPEFFENGEPGLEAGRSINITVTVLNHLLIFICTRCNPILCFPPACHDIDQWPPPQPGEELSLPLMGTVIQTRIPSIDDKLTGSYPSPRPEAQVR